jgi:hypothetical protein
VGELHFDNESRSEAVTELDKRQRFWSTVFVRTDAQRVLFRSDILKRQRQAGTPEYVCHSLVVVSHDSQGSLTAAFALYVRHK